MSESWLEKSARLSQALAASREGGKLLKIERIAAESGLSTHTVDHLVRAYDFLERMRSEDKELAKLIAALPSHGVLTVERWYARNRDEVLAYLKDNEKPSIRQLTAAERQARSLPPAAPARHAIDIVRSAGAGSNPGAELQTLMNWARVKPFDLTKVDWEFESEAYERAHGVDFHGLSPDQDKVGLLIGPNSEATVYYTRNARSVWFNAVSAAILFPVVIMLLPTKAAQSACLTSMPLPPNGERGWPKWNSLDSVRGQPRSGPARPATPTKGIILITTPETLLSDWQR
jgi:hypothetical protein